MLCPEGRGIFPGMTVTENLNMGAYTRKDKAEMARTSSGSSTSSPA